MCSDDTFQTQRIDGRTRLVALLGDPVAHSLSPAIHNHLFAALGLPFAYVALNVKSCDVHTIVRTLRACEFAGANVTVPHKQAVMPYCDVVSDLSAAIGAVNTLYFRDGLLHGTSTDPQGFFGSLEAMKIEPRDQRIIILGNGGTARTLACALALQRPPRTLTLVGRDAGRVGNLAEFVRRVTGFAVGATSLDGPDLPRLMEECTLLVNCTSVGMLPDVAATPLPAHLLHRAMTVFDAIYNPSPTRLLAEARAAGCTTQDGLAMLVGQGLASFELWTGVRPDLKSIDMAELRNVVTL